MRVLVLFAHPVETSFSAALCRRAVEGLKAAGHEVDLCDLHAEGFDPVLSREERLGYHRVPENLAPVASHVARLRAAEALVIVSPIWSFGFPAILKGYFDRVFLPGVSFRLEGGKVRPNLTHIRRIAVVATYGGAWWRALLLRDPPRMLVFGWLKRLTGARVDYVALYDMNRADEAKRRGFLEKVGRFFESF
jgi:putative NADPH-quinone reductase